LSEITEELPRKVVTAWRAFAATSEFQQGIDWLRHNKAPKMSGGNEAEMLKAALGWNAYMQALTDVEDALTYIEKEQPSAEQPPLQT
jgi:hypothetical protein